MTRSLRSVLTTLGLLTTAACGEMVLGSDPAGDPITVFDAAWHSFDRYYAFFEHNRIDWNAVYQRYRPEVEGGSGEAALRAALCGMVAEARSYHASLTYPGGSCGHPDVAHLSNYSPALVAEMVRPEGSTPSGKITYGRTDGDIGYVRIPSFAGGGWGGEIDAAIQALSGVDGIVLDIRNNGGGSESTAKEIAARFVDQERVYRLARFRNGPAHTDFTPAKEYRIRPAGSRFTGPVAVLTNRYNGSAAEDFLLMMLTSPNVVTVGDTTIGNSSNPLVLELPNGWILRIPQSIQYTPTGEVIEGRGIAPMIPVMLTAADSARGVDPILLAAITELKQR